MIVRSQIGLDAWKYCESELEVRQIDRNHVIFSQLLEHRIRNIEYADFKQRNIKNETGINLSAIKSMRTAQKNKKYALITLIFKYSLSQDE